MDVMDVMDVVDKSKDPYSQEGDPVDFADPDFADSDSDSDSDFDSSSAAAAPFSAAAAAASFSATAAAAASSSAAAAAQGKQGQGQGQGQNESLFTEQRIKSLFEALNENQLLIDNKLELHLCKQKCSKLRAVEAMQFPLIRELCEIPHHPLNALKRLSHPSSLERLLDGYYQGYEKYITGSSDPNTFYDKLKLCTNWGPPRTFLGYQKGDGTRTDTNAGTVTNYNISSTDFTMGLPITGANRGSQSQEAMIERFVKMAHAEKYVKHHLSLESAPQICDNILEYCLEKKKKGDASELLGCLSGLHPSVCIKGLPPESGIPDGRMLAGPVQAVKFGKMTVTSIFNLTEGGYFTPVIVLSVSGTKQVVKLIVDMLRNQSQKSRPNPGSGPVRDRQILMGAKLDGGRAESCSEVIRSFLNTGDQYQSNQQIMINDLGVPLCCPDKELFDTTVFDALWVFNPDDVVTPLTYNGFTSHGEMLKRIMDLTSEGTGPRGGRPKKGSVDLYREIPADARADSVLNLELDDKTLDAFLAVVGIRIKLGETTMSLKDFMSLCFEFEGLEDNINGAQLLMLQRVLSAGFLHMFSQGIKDTLKKMRPGVDVRKIQYAIVEYPDGKRYRTVNFNDSGTVMQIYERGFKLVLGEMQKQFYGQLGGQANLYCLPQMSSGELNKFYTDPNFRHGWFSKNLIKCIMAACHTDAFKGQHGVYNMLLFDENLQKLLLKYIEGRGDRRRWSNDENSMWETFMHSLHPPISTVIYGILKQFSSIVNGFDQKAELKPSDFEEQGGELVLKPEPKKKFEQQFLQEVDMLPELIMGKDRVTIHQSGFRCSRIDEAFLDGRLRAGFACGNPLDDRTWINNSAIKSIEFSLRYVMVGPVGIMKNMLNVQNRLRIFKSKCRDNENQDLVTEFIAAGDNIEGEIQKMTIILTGDINITLDDIYQELARIILPEVRKLGLGVGGGDMGVIEVIGKLIKQGENSAAECLIFIVVNKMVSIKYDAAMQNAQTKQKWKTKYNEFIRGSELKITTLEKRIKGLEGACRSALGRTVSGQISEGAKRKLSELSDCSQFDDIYLRRKCLMEELSARCFPELGTAQQRALSNNELIATLYTYLLLKYKQPGPSITWENFTKGEINRLVTLKPEQLFSEIDRVVFQVLTPGELPGKLSDKFVSDIMGKKTELTDTYLSVKEYIEKNWGLWLRSILQRFDYWSEPVALELETLIAQVAKRDKDFRKEFPPVVSDDGIETPNNVSSLKISLSNFFQSNRFKTNDYENAKKFFELWLNVSGNIGLYENFLKAIEGMSQKQQNIFKLSVVNLRTASMPAEQLKDLYEILDDEYYKKSSIQDPLAKKKKVDGGGSRKTRKRKNKRKSPKTLKKRRKQVKTIKRNKRRKSVLKKKSNIKKKPSQKFKRTHKRIRKKKKKRSKK